MSTLYSLILSDLMIFSSELSLIIHQSCLMLDGHFMLKAFFLFTTMKQISVNKVKFSTLTSVQFERKVWLIASHYFADETLDCDKSLSSPCPAARIHRFHISRCIISPPPPPSLPPPKHLWNVEVGFKLRWCWKENLEQNKVLAPVPLNMGMGSDDVLQNSL